MGLAFARRGSLIVNKPFLGYQPPLDRHFVETAVANVLRLAVVQTEAQILFMDLVATPALEFILAYTLHKLARQSRTCRIEPLIFATCERGFGSSVPRLRPDSL